MPAIKKRPEFEVIKCPFCGSTDLEQDKYDRWTCLSCFKQWDEKG